MNRRGFTLIELLVVVAIIGILAGAGLVAYSGYVKSAKRKSAQNIMLQISLGQVEHYSDEGEYYGSTGSDCSPDTSSSTDIETKLLGGADSINEDMGYFICTVKSGSDFTIVAEEDTKGSEKCKLTMNKSTKVTRSSFC